MGDDIPTFFVLTGYGLNFSAEDTLWTGIPGNYTNPDAPKALSEVRRLVDIGEYAEATASAVKLFGKPADVCYLPHLVYLFI